MARRTRSKLGELLVETNKLEREDLRRALDEQAKSRDKLGNVLVRMGLISEKEIMQVLSEQLGIPIVNLYAAPLH